MGGLGRKGTVTPLESQFPPEEVHKATKQFQDAIAEKNNELHVLQRFVADNNNLVNLVQKLPEQLSHDVMVPFGKAAFFPGRLIHTNEFMVLLGEGYYADRTSKQTVDILQRRGESLNSQVDSLQAMINNLSSFVNVTDSEVAGGLVEIREEYLEGDSEEEESESDSAIEDVPSVGNDTSKEVDYASFLALMDELEKKEALAEKNGDDSDQSEKTTDGFDDSPYQRPVDNNPQNIEGSNEAIPLDQRSNRNVTSEFPKKHNHQEYIADQLNFANLAVQPQVKEGKTLAQNVKSIDRSAKPPIVPKEKISQATLASKIEVQHQTSQPSFDSLKAFTGSIIEHGENLEKASREQSSTSQVSGSQPLKPVSRFKMQRK
ncbi:unnamed protein product [Lathyrus oleraceus]|uniref:Uncharacterized protein n=2 Tax=Pisum sativum TaxID=3888 RepID=A0A9D4VPL1_PEA|nr:uncharacterized protein LOC127102442 isoform X1 [Pisum sativum]XP_050895770.1 uncharacterized protein LOC127102442 isoform X1 [Pisum sativum]XP_050895771.1 uncharacterized protein LOC127102442 isoform X1 [Pisum sativum]KAI5387823.1 hypothetical protein KIW84_073787 [Pisum sativum]